MLNGGPYNLETNGGCGVDNFYELNRDYGNLNREREEQSLLFMFWGLERTDVITAK